MKKWVNAVRALSDLKPYKQNPRAHTDEDIGRLADAIKRFGFTAPILIDKKNRVLAGHGRARAAFKLGMKTVPVRIIGDDWTEAEKRAYTIWDNQSTILGTWDVELLRSELLELKASDIGLGLLGFSTEDLLLYTADKPVDGADPEDVPDPPKNPVSRIGNLWIMGIHRLLCGDSTKPEDVARVRGKHKPHLMVTDPPYGVEYDAKKARATNVAVGSVMNDHKADWRDAWALFDGDVAYVWHADLRARQVVESLESVGFVCRAQIIWDKTRPVMSRGHYHFQHEPCWYAVRAGSTGHWSGDRMQSTVWPIAHRKSETGHSTQKPIECMKRPIENNSKRGDYVYEPFSGSFTTGIACEMTGRRALAIEIMPAYVDVGVLRWQTLTGKEATLDGDGRTFAQIAADRAKKKAPKKRAKKLKQKPETIKRRSTASAGHSPSLSAVSGDLLLPSEAS